MLGDSDWLLRKGCPVTFRLPVSIGTCGRCGGFQGLKAHRELSEREGKNLGGSWACDV